MNTQDMDWKGYSEQKEKQHIRYLLLYQITLRLHGLRQQ